MKNATAHARKLDALLKQLKAHYATAAASIQVDPADPILQVVVGFLEWEAASRTAELGVQRLLGVAVDVNDLRVFHTAEIVDLLGPRYPLVHERAARLRDVLNSIFNLEHATSLGGIAGKSKRDIRAYLDALPGMVPYVAARTTLFCFDGHAVPTDQKLVDLLRTADAVDADADVAEVNAYLERHIKASDAREVALLFRAWSDDGKPLPSSRPAKKPTAQTPAKPASKPAEKKKISKKK